MLLKNKNYRQEIKDLINKAPKADLAVAFWGRGSEALFDSWTDKSFRIICNLALGGTNPDVIAEIMTLLPNEEIKQLDNLHAKLVLTDEGMIVGSANMSSNGLGLEGNETAGFEELGLLTRDEQALEAARNWFEEQWKDARTIEPEDLDNARIAWQQRRAARPWAPFAEQPSLLDLNAEALADRPVFFAVYRDELTEEAEQAYEEVNAEHAPMDGTLHVYEGYPDDAFRKHATANAIIIPVIWGEDDEVEIEAPQRPVPELAGDYRAGNRNNVLLDYTFELPEEAVDQIPFRIDEEAREDQALCARVGEWLAEDHRPQNEEADIAIFCPVADFLQWHNREI